MNEPDLRRQLRGWISSHAKTSAASMQDDTKLLEQGILSSLDIVELVLFIESLRGVEVDTEAIEPEVFTSIDTLYEAFFRPLHV